jgi:hypothetical protein
MHGVCIDGHGQHGLLLAAEQLGHGKPRRLQQRRAAATALALPQVKVHGGAPVGVAVERASDDLGLRERVEGVLGACCGGAAKVRARRGRAVRKVPHEGDRVLGRQVR